MKRLDTTQLGDDKGGAIPDDRYQPFLLVALILLIVAEAMSERRPMPHPRGLRSPTAAPRRRWIPAFLRAPTALLLLAASLLGSCSVLSGSDADRLYLAGDHDAALRAYRDLLKERPDVPELHVNAGNAYYQLRRLDEALDEYAIAIRDGTPTVRVVALYQRGNALFRKGQLDEAREAYKAVLRIDPSDRDAKFNIEVIDRVVLRPEPGSSGPPQPGASAASGDQGADASAGPGGQGQPQGSQQPAASSQPGTEGPQASGAPEGLGQASTGSGLEEALLAFRRQLTLEEALRFLDALEEQQRGIEELLKGPAPSARPSTDPSY